MTQRKIRVLHLLYSLGVGGTERRVLRLGLGLDPHCYEALLIPARSVPAIEKAIATLMDDPRLCQQLAARGHELIESRFTWTLNAQAHFGVYQRLLGLGAVKRKNLEPA